MQLENMSSSDEAQTGDVGSNVGVTYAERRKWSKPVMEKKRRARINSSLNELKAILLEALKKDSTRHSKLEKADILEMTVNYLKNVNSERQRLSVSLSIDSTVVDKYRAGFNECRNEVMRFLSTCEGVTVDVRTRLLSRLASCSHSIRSQPSACNEPDFEPAFPANDRIANGGPCTALAQAQNANNVKQTLPSESFNCASIRRPMVANIAPRLDPKMQGNSKTSQTPARNTVISDNVPLASATAINGFETGIGNVAFLLPAQGTGTTFLAPITSSSNVISSPEKHLIQSQTSAVQGQDFTGENVSSGESIVPPRGPNIILLQPVFQPVPPSPLTSPIDNKMSNISDTSSGYHAGDDLNSTPPRLSISPYKPNNRRHNCDSSEKNTSFSGSEDPMGSDCEKRSVSRDNFFEEKSKKVAQVRPLDSTNHPNSLLHQGSLGYRFGSQGVPRIACNTLTQDEKDKPRINKQTNKRERGYSDDQLRQVSTSSKRGRLSVPYSTEDSSSNATDSNSGNQYLHKWNKKYGKYHIPPSDVAVGVNVTTPMDLHQFNNIQTSNLISIERNMFLTDQAISPQSIPTSTIANSNAVNNKPNPWRPWSKTVS